MSTNDRPPCFPYFAAEYHTFLNNPMLSLFSCFFLIKCSCDCCKVLNMIIIYIDIILLSILLLLILFTCGYCVYRVHRLQRSGQVAILLRPTKVLFSHKKEGATNEQLRTVVAYQNPFTGDYCVNKSRVPKGYVNSMESPDSPDSGVSDAYEPLNLVPRPEERSLELGHSSQVTEPVKSPISPIYDNSVSKTWKWEYTEYQI